MSTQKDSLCYILKCDPHYYSLAQQETLWLSPKVWIQSKVSGLKLDKQEFWQKNSACVHVYVCM